LQVELPPPIYSEENSTEENESYNLSEPQIQTGENVSYNESNISADINVAVEITGETGEELSSPENAEDINQSENETEPVEVLPEVLSEKISVEDGCAETCSVFPFNAEYLLFEISDGSLFIDNFSFVLPESGFYLKDNFTFVNITVGEYENINLNDYFSGSGIFFDFTSSEGYSYEISESSLKIIGLNEGSWMGKFTL
jgi:hypothetical protein